MPNAFDCIVVGVGGMGSAALNAAAKRGLKVLGIDQLGPAHNRGSSHGRTRIIRRAYFEHPSYVPLSIESFEKWRELEQGFQKPLLKDTSLLQIGRREQGIVAGVIESAIEHDLEYEEMDASECRRRFPMFHFEDEDVAVFEKNAGILMVEDCVTAAIESAKSAGAEFAFDSQIDNFHLEGNSIEISIGDRSLTTKNLILCPGAWINTWASQFAELKQIPMRVLRKHQHWYDLPEINDPQGVFPTFLFESNGGYFYGFPNFDGKGFKIAEHTGGEEVTQPSDLDRSACPDDLKRVEQFLASRIRSSCEHRKHCICMYTTTPDQHFILDRLPSAPNVVVAAGFSGHGFKFAPVIGEYLVDLLEGSTDPRFEFLRLSRNVL